MAKILIEQGKDVVLDGTFSKKEYRKNAIDLCESLSTKIIFIKCTASINECIDRLESRENPFYSEANAEVIQRLFATWETDSDDAFVVDTNLPKQVCLNMIFDYYEKSIRISNEQNSETKEKLTPLPPVTLTPAHINIVDDPCSLNDTLVIFSNFFKKNNIEWYIQSSLAAHLYGVKDRNVTDVDIRVNTSLDLVHEKLIKEVDFPVRIRGPVCYEYGEFRNDCLIVGIPHLNTHVDITNKIITYRRDKDTVFDVPFDKTLRFHKISKAFPDQFPVCSPEYLVVYKFANQRGKNERKNDLQEAAHIMGLLFRGGQLP